MPADAPPPDFSKLLLGLAATGLGVGILAWLNGRDDLAGWVRLAATLPVLLALMVEIVRSLLRGEVGLDIVAALSMSAALIFGEYRAAVVVAMMYSGGTFLERFAEGRARREMTDLLGRVPRTAMRHQNGALAEIALETITPGDRLLIRQGDVAPVDGTVAAGRAVMDQSALTGEAMPVRLGPGDAVISGSTGFVAQMA